MKKINKKTKKLFPVFMAFAFLFSGIIPLFSTQAVTVNPTCPVSVKSITSGQNQIKTDYIGSGFSTVKDDWEVKIDGVEVIVEVIEEQGSSGKYRISINNEDHDLHDSSPTEKEDISITYLGGGCPIEEETFELVAYKVVCETEEDLPDWAKDSNRPTQITESLIENYVSDSDGVCWFEQGWEFEWGEEDTEKMPGDHTGVATEGNWTPFGPTDEDGVTTTDVDYTDQNHVWVREVLKEGYIPFSDFEGGEESVSAELLCSTDGYKYDNYDRIDDPEKDETYYCVGFNVPEEPEIPVYESEGSCPTGQITEQVGSYQVDSTDPEGIDILLGEGIYLFEASGTFIPTSAENWHADAGYSTNDSWSSVLSDYGIQGNNPHYGAHSLLADLGEGVGVVNWGDYDSSHEYSFYYEIENEDDYPFLIGDRYGTWFSTEWDEQVGMEDNTGSLDLDIHKCVEEEEDKVEINATKIVCEYEEYLPNMAGGNQITATTATDWLAEEDNADHCWIDEDWEFQWKEGKITEAADNEGELSDWNTFTANQPALISNLSGGETIALREVMDNRHFSFSGVEGGDRSAEFYCADDVGNYDNLEWIQDVTLGDSYHCVGFNAPKTTDLELCKIDEQENKLGGWEFSMAYEKTNLSFNGTTETNQEDDNYGCLTFNNVPYGDYQLDETPQEGWGNVSGLGDLVVDEETTSLTVVNRDESDIFNLIAHKVVCDSESDFPDWVEDENYPEVLTEDMIVEYVDDSEGACRFEPNWEFEWAEKTVSDPGGYYTDYGGEDWNTFGPTNSDGRATDQIDFEDTIWIREVLQEGYLPFSDDPGGDYSESAELICHTDGYNYDNYESIDDPIFGNDYYCVAFNTPIEENIEVCKLDEMDNYLEGWQVALVSEEPLIDSTPINVTDDTGTEVNLPEGDYLIEVSGTYRYGNEAMIADAGYSYRPTNEWMSGFDLENSIGLMVQINNNPIYWGPFTTDHVYTSIYHHEGNDPVKLHIEDNIYGDNLNNGDFNFQIFEIISEGETGEDGCVNFSAPLGSYLLEEENRMDWMNVSGLGSVDITEEETFNIINSEDTDKVKVTAHKIVCDSEEYLPNWGSDRSMGSPITSQTASDFLASVNEDREVCRLEPDWEFEWGYYGQVSNPGDNYTGVAGDNWNTFGPTDTNGMISVYIPLLEDVDRLDFREVLQEGYIPFSFEDNNKTNDDNFSAEFYCGEDVFNYDNWDWIENPEDGEEYHCIAFNALEEVDDGDSEVLSFSRGRSRGSTNLLSENTKAEEDEMIEGVTVEGVTALDNTSMDPEPCGVYLNDFLSYGPDNDPEEVMKLQLFLNVHMDEDLPVDGVFGIETLEAVERFQLRYKEEVLKPWVEAGIYDNENIPTGYVFETTRRWINLIMCPELDLDMPDLSVYFTEGFEYDFELSDLEEEDEVLEAVVELEEPIEEEENEEDEEEQAQTELLAGTISGGGKINISRVLAGLIGLVSLSYFGYQGYLFFKKKKILKSWNN